MSVAKARIIAHLIGDGALYQTRHDYVIKYEVKDLSLIKQFSSDLIEVYGLEPHFHLNSSGKTGKPLIFARLRSKIVYEDLLQCATYRSYTWCIGKAIMDASLPIKRGFLRALFDDEGTVVKEGKRGIIRFYSVNHSGTLQVQHLLKEVGLPSILRPGYGAARNVYGVNIPALEDFASVIGFSLERKQKKLMDFLGERE